MFFSIHLYKSNKQTNTVFSYGDQGRAYQILNLMPFLIKGSCAREYQCKLYRENSLFL